MSRECFASMQRHGPPHLQIAIVNSSATRGPGAPYPLLQFPLPPYFDDLPWNHQGDFGSFALLAEFGGVYLDTDMLLLHSLRPFLDLLSRFEFVGFGGHTLDPGVHHGVMVARPGSELLRRVYHAALAAYAAEGGCAGSACSRRGQLRWLTSLDAFTREAAAMRKERPAHPCAYARLPTRFFEPGVGEHATLCAPTFESVMQRGTPGPSAAGDTMANAAAPSPQDTALVVATMQAALSGTLRLVHLSPSKYEYAQRFPGHRGAPLLLHCPLLGFLHNVSLGRGDLSLLQRVAAASVDAWEQRVGDFMPS